MQGLIFIDSGLQFSLGVRRSGERQEGVKFVTPDAEPLQLGFLVHKAGVKIAPHRHRILPRTVPELHEVVYIERGEVETQFFDEAGKMLGGVTLKTGDTILLTAGGHGFNILKDTKMVEVKQGPFFGTSEDRIRLPGPAMEKE